MSTAKAFNPPVSAPSHDDTLPTMYDLPSEAPEEPGLPDEFHYYQPLLLGETFVPANYSSEEVFVAADLNLYYDLNHLNWYKRPDWFAVLGTTRFYQKRDLRLSYVIWQEKISPYLVVELLSSGTEDEDLGRTTRSTSQPPSKWTVYEQILQIPYYVVYSRHTGEFHCFQLTEGRYQERETPEHKFWLAEADLGIGLWEGRYRDFDGHWLRFYDTEKQWIATPVESQTQRAEQAEQELARLRALLKEKGIEDN